MKSDTQMWASVVLSEHLRSGQSVEDTTLRYVGRTLAMLCKFCRQPVSEYWDRLAADGDRAYLPYILTQRTGRTMIEIMDVMSGNTNAINEALDKHSWTLIKDLPDIVWYYIGAVSGMSKDEWGALPELCNKILKEPVQCPKCFYTQIMTKFGKPKEIPDPYQYDSSEVSFVFTCPQCSTKIMYDIRKNESVEFQTSPMMRSKLYRWVVVGVVAGMLLGAIRAIIR